ncbi:MAG: HAMP domain-containing histidine kinase [Lachnospiraceae bacterium]|nr:HAMP domain-containing histidine kinase [Lachnospiraceae bacterium]
MKNYYKLVLLLGVFYFAALMLFAAVTVLKSGETGQEAEIIKLNDITKDAQMCWDHLQDLGKNDYGVSFVILDSGDTVLYASGANAEKGRHGITTAIKRRYPYTYVIRDERILGSVILIDDGGRAAKIRLLLLTGTFGLLILAGAFLFGGYVRKRIVIPFRNLRDFAGDIAEGKLDQPLSMDRDNLFGAFSESFDIMREELARSKRREIELQKKERELVASLSHDLKTPITGIKLTTELLKAKLESGQELSGNASDLAEKLDNIYKKADQIDVLVNDLFSSTLEDLGQFKVSCTDEKASILQEIVKKYDDRNLAASESVPEVLIRMDGRRMSQVIGNIISNSYKYAGTRIDITYRIVEDFLEMHLADHGPGVPPEELSLITNKFYRGKQWADSKESGNGLGLYIAAMLMEKMDGQLLVMNTDDGFGITLLIPLS